MALSQANATHCKHGHEFTPENTYIRVRNGRRHRYCRACQTRRGRGWRGTMNKAKKLAIASVAAPRIRRGGGRPINVTARDGTVLRRAPLEEVQRGILAGADIRFDTTLNERPAYAICQNPLCRKQIPLRHCGVVPATCPNGCVRECSACGKRVGKSNSYEASREGRLPMCHRCAIKKHFADRRAKGLPAVPPMSEERRAKLADLNRTRPGNAKLDFEKVREIRRRHANGETTLSLAAAFGVSRMTIQSVIARRVWAHVTNEP